VQLWFWLTPIVYVLDILPKETQDMLAWNPMTHFVTAFREVILYARVPDLAALAVLAVVGLCLLAMALFGFQRLEKDLRDFI
jgi:lipopolysaccharide transport system permease protein